MIPEWLSFRNEFCSRGKFVPHSHDKIERLRQRHSCSRGFCARSETQSTRNEVRSQFTWYQNEILYQNDGFIRIEFQNDLYGERNVVSVSCKHKQRNIWRWNELVPDCMSFWFVNSPSERAAEQRNKSCGILSYVKKGVKLWSPTKPFFESSRNDTHTQ